MRLTDRPIYIQTTSTRRELWKEVKRRRMEGFVKSQREIAAAIGGSLPAQEAIGATMRNQHDNLNSDPAMGRIMSWSHLSDEMDDLVPMTDVLTHPNTNILDELQRLGLGCHAPLARRPHRAPGRPARPGHTLPSTYSESPSSARALFARCAGESAETSVRRSTEKHIAQVRPDPLDLASLVAQLVPERQDPTLVPNHRVHVRSGPCMRGAQAPHQEDTTTSSSVTTADTPRSCGSHGTSSTSCAAKHTPTRRTPGFASAQRS